MTDIDLELAARQALAARFPASSGVLPLQPTDRSASRQPDLRAGAPHMELPDFDEPRHGRRRSAAVLAVVAAIAVTALVVVALAGQARRSAPGHSVTHGRPSSTNDPEPAARGQREWRYHGIAVDVPASWPANDTRCGYPQRDTVLIDQGPIPSCTSGSPPTAAWAEFTTFHSATAPTYPFFLLPHARRQHITVNGTPAVRIAGRSHTSICHGRFVVIIAITRLHVAVTSVAPTSAQARRLAGTVHRVPPTPGGAHGVLHGTLRISSGHGQPFRPTTGSVQVHHNPYLQNASPVATTQADEAGRYTFTLPPGSYSLSVTIPNHTRTALSCRTVGSQTVTDQGTSTANLECR